MSPVESWSIQIEFLEMKTIKFNMKNILSEIKNRFYLTKEKINELPGHSNKNYPSWNRKKIGGKEEKWVSVSCGKNSSDLMYIIISGVPKREEREGGT